MKPSATQRNTLVVIPCYNESQRLDLAQIEEFVGGQSEVRLLFVDDGSSDATAQILANLAQRLPESVSWMQLPVNSGKAEAVRQGVLVGLKEAPEFVGYWDADFATPLYLVGDFRRMLLTDSNLLGVLGSRVQRLGARIERNPFRHYAGRVFASLASLVLGIAVYDTQCGAKMFRAGPEMRAAFAQSFDSSWIFDVEVLARLKRMLGAKILATRLYEYPLPEWRDVAGSKLSTTRGAGAFLELWKIFRKYRR